MVQSLSPSRRVAHSREHHAGAEGREGRRLDAAGACDAQGPARRRRRPQLGADPARCLSARRSSARASRRRRPGLPSRPRSRTARRTSRPRRPRFAAVVAAERPVGEILHQPQRDRALRREEARRLARLVEHRVVDGVDEADAQRLLRVDDAAGEDQLLGDAETAHAREPLRAAPARDDPEIDLGLAELRSARRVADVARERELAAAAERKAVDRSDRRLRHRLEQPAGLVPERSPLLRLGRRRGHSCT